MTEGVEARKKAHIERILKRTRETALRFNMPPPDADRAVILSEIVETKIAVEDILKALENMQRPILEGL